MTARIPWSKPFFGREEARLIGETAESGWLTQGPRVRAFEERVSSLTGCRYCVAVNSGTAALDVALKLLDVGLGDEIIVPAFAYIASANAILYQGAVPVFADVEPETLNLDPDDTHRKITGRTKGIIALDYAGHSADWNALRRVAADHGLFLLEDAAPGFGGSYHGQALGTLGDIGITSFHTAKIFSSVEGGMVFCRDDEQAERARVIRSQGESSREKYVHPVLGHNYRLSDLHAAVGLAQLGRYDDVLSRRAAAAAYYTDRLGTGGAIRVPTARPGCRHAWFLYATRVPARDAVRALLTDAGIETNVSWPHPVYAQAHFKPFFREHCRVAEEACRSVLALPMYYELTKDEQDVVVDELARTLEAAR